MPISRRLLRPTQKSFSPRQITGLALWLDASEAASAYTTGGGPSEPPDGFVPSGVSANLVAWWDASIPANDPNQVSISVSGGVVGLCGDLSGNENNASQLTTALRPQYITNALNGKPVVRFNGSTGLFGDLQSGPTEFMARAVFVVCRIGGSVTNGRVFSTASAAGQDFATGQTIPCCTNAGSTTQLSTYAGANVSASDGFNTFGVFTHVSNGSSITNSTNGAANATASFTTTQLIERFGIGCAAHDQSAKFIGDIAEIIFYDGLLQPEEQRVIERYLAKKWGIRTVHEPAAELASPVASPLALEGCALWLDASDRASLYATDVGTVTPVTSPLDLAVGGCAGWWDASRTDRMWNATSGGSLVTNGAHVLRLDDLSGNGRHLVQGTSAYAPTRSDAALNGRTVLDFAGTKAATAGVIGDFDFLHNTQGGTVFLVVKPASVADPQNYGYIMQTSLGGASTSTGINLFFDDRTSYPRNNYFNVSTTRGTAGDSVGFTELDNFFASPTSFTNLCVTYNGSTPFAADRLIIYRDGVRVGGLNSASATPSSGTASQALRFGNDGLTATSFGALAEAIVFNTTLSPANRARVEAYLAAKWGISGVHAGAGLATSSGAAVGAWLDRSGNNRHAAQVIAANRPALQLTATNGKPAIHFGGSGFLNSSATIGDIVGSATHSPCHMAARSSAVRREPAVSISVAGTQEGSIR